MSKKYKQKWLSFSILTAVFVATSGAIAQPPNNPQVRGPSKPFEFNEFNKPPHYYPNFFAYCEMAGNQLGLINTETDQIIQVPLATLADNNGNIEEDRWTGSSCQHVWVEPDGQTLYVTIDAVVEEETEEEEVEKKEIPATLLVLKLNALDWNNEEPSADLELAKVLLLEEGPGESALHVPEPYGDFPVTDWFPGYTQGHGPSFLPGSHFTYLTEWTSPKIRVLDTRTHEWVEGVDPIEGREGIYPHGINFNQSGTLGLGTGYFYDHDEIDVYRPKKKHTGEHTGELIHLGSIPLADEEGHAAFTHYTFWLNDRYALTVTMQVWPTADTPADTPKSENFIGPSVWLLDAVYQTAEKIIPDAKERWTPEEIQESPELVKGLEAVFRPGSDLVVANGKLYVAEEDSLEGRLPIPEDEDDDKPDGYVSIFDLRGDVRHPRFLKRLVPAPTNEDFDVMENDGFLPPDFAIAHGLGVTPDNRYVYVASYASGYILKIDTAIDEVVAVFSEEDGVTMPHGGFIPGNASDSSFARPPLHVKPPFSGFFSK